MFEFSSLFICHSNKMFFSCFTSLKDTVIFHATSIIIIIIIIVHCRKFNITTTNVSPQACTMQQQVSWSQGN